MSEYFTPDSFKSLAEISPVYAPSFDELTFCEPNLKISKSKRFILRYVGHNTNSYGDLMFFNSS